MIGVAERQIARTSTSHLPEGTTLTTIDPVVDVVGLFEVQPGLLRINKDYGWLRAADVLADGDATIVADMAEGTHASSRPGARPGASRRRSGPSSRADRDAAGTLALRARAQGAGARARRPAQAARLPGARRLRGLVDRVRGPHAARPERPAGEPGGSSAADGRQPPAGQPRPGRLRRWGRPASRGGGTARPGTTTVDELEPMPSTKKLHVGAVMSATR